MFAPKKIFIPLIFSYLILFTFSCKRENPEAIITHLTGYWEIETVKPKQGESKTFTLNMLIDYIEIENNEGFRKKVAPQPDGTFFITEDAEAIVVEIENKQVKLIYSTPFDSWSETVLKADEKQLVVKNEHEMIYTYKRHEPLNLTQ